MGLLRITLSVAIVFSLFTALKAQTCPNANIVLATQADVNQFAAGGAYDGCSSMAFVLTIDDDGTDPITDLSPLSSLTEIIGGSPENGSLRIFNTAVSDFSGLSNITDVSGTIWFKSNTGIVDMSAFANLNPVGVELRIEDNSSLTDCSVFCDFRVETPSINIGGNAVGICQSSAAFNQACGPVPIELNYFNANKQAQSAMLTWETLSELNNSGFSLEKSTDGQNWKTIGWVDGQGTSRTATQYHFLDHTPASKSNYYRMKQIDFDGRFEYSHVVNVYFESLERTIYAYPNPAKDVVTIGGLTNDAAPTIRVFNTLGQEVLNTVGSSLSIANLPMGIYTLEIMVDGVVILERLVVE